MASTLCFVVAEIWADWESGGGGGGGQGYVHQTNHYRGEGGFRKGKFLPGKIPPQSLKVMGKIAPHFSMVKCKA